MYGVNRLLRRRSINPLCKKNTNILAAFSFFLVLAERRRKRRRKQNIKTEPVILSMILANRSTNQPTSITRKQFHFISFIHFFSLCNPKLLFGCFSVVVFLVVVVVVVQSIFFLLKNEKKLTSIGFFVILFVRHIWI